MPNRPQPPAQKPRPYKAQGDVLKTARGDRTQAEIAEALGFEKKHVGKYQNWEYGYNQPSPKQWAAIKKVLDVDAARLYAHVQGHEKGAEPSLDPVAVLALVQSAERSLEALKLLCAPHVSNTVLKSHGIVRIDTKTGKEIKEKSRS